MESVPLPYYVVIGPTQWSVSFCADDDAGDRGGDDLGLIAAAVRH